MKSLIDYKDLIGADALSEIYNKADELRGTRVLHINSTRNGGGVAEILGSLVPLMNDLGISTEWRVIDGPNGFFQLTKGFHNALQGGTYAMDSEGERLYLETNQAFSECCRIEADCVIVHDPQPLPLIEFCEKRVPWVWRCHVDLSRPDPGLWSYLCRFVNSYDVCLLSSHSYLKEDLEVPQRIIHPAIDPLSRKNRDMDAGRIEAVARSHCIPLDKPIVAQVSRMDTWKDPEGLLEVFDLVRRDVDCRLLFCYAPSIDDPEGIDVLHRTCRRADALGTNGRVLFVEGSDPEVVNAIQRQATVLAQKSIKEGFCLCVTEALWKSKPVVGTNVGGIPLQLKQAENGFLVDPRDNEAFADRIVEVIKNPEMAADMGSRGREIVRRSFLITRLLTDYIDLLRDVLLGHNGHHRDALDEADPAATLNWRWQCRI